MKTVLLVAGARPNFMKVAPIHALLSSTEDFRSVLVHTGQHYDPWMSEVFFRDLAMRDPEYSLGVGSGTHAEQTAGVMRGIEPVMLEVNPDVVVVVGDVNSTLAAAVTAAKLRFPLAHVEAGLRSFNRSMPEEVNRLVADAVSDLLFAPSSDAVVNLRHEGHPEERIHFVGNVMIDTLRMCLDRAASSTVLQDQGLRPREYFLATLHRPANVDDVADLRKAADILIDTADVQPLALVAHPRTARRLADSGLDGHLGIGGVRVLEPLGYLDFLELTRNATAVLTDSGGIQEETTVLGVPCITLRSETERPITVTEGTNTVTGLDRDAVRTAVQRALTADRTPRVPALWDGRASERIVDVLGAFCA